MSFFIQKKTLKKCVHTFVKNEFSLSNFIQFVYISVQMLLVSSGAPLAGADWSRSFLICKNASLAAVDYRASYKTSTPRKRARPGRIAYQHLEGGGREKARNEKRNRGLDEGRPARTQLFFFLCTPQLCPSESPQIMHLFIKTPPSGCFREWFFKSQPEISWKQLPFRLAKS